MEMIASIGKSGMELEEEERREMGKGTHFFLEGYMPSPQINVKVHKRSEFCLVCL